MRPPRLNRGHPLASGLVACFAPTQAGSVVDLTGRRGSGIAGRVETLSYGLAACDFSIPNAITADLAFATGAWTVAALFRVITAPITGGKYPAIFQRSDYTSESNNHGWSLQMRPPGDGNPGYNFSVLSNNIAPQYILGANVVTAGDHLLVGTSAGGSGGQRWLYLDGVEIATKSASGPANPATTASGNLINVSDTDRVPLYAGYAWDRALTLAEVKGLWLSGTDLIRARRNRVGWTAGVAVSPLTIDGHAATAPTGGSSQSITLTTTMTDDVIVVVVYQETGNAGIPLRTVSSISGGSLTWTKRSSVSNTTPIPGGMEVWWARSAAILTAVNITVNITGTTDDWGIVAFGVHGCATNPWDSHVSLPASAIAANPSISGLSTTQANDLLLAFFGEEASSAARNNVPSGFTFVDGAGTGAGGLFAQASVAAKEVTSAQSGITVAWGAGATNASVMIVDALTAVDPSVMARISQIGLLSIEQGTPMGRISQIGLLSVEQGIPAGRISQIGMLVIHPTVDPSPVGSGSSAAMLLF